MFSCWYCPPHGAAGWFLLVTLWLLCIGAVVWAVTLLFPVGGRLRASREPRDTAADAPADHHEP